MTLGPWEMGFNQLGMDQYLLPSGYLTVCHGKIHHF